MSELRIPESYRAGADEPARQRDLERYFDALVEHWSADTAFQSSIQKIAMHPAYQRIIGMGPQILPFIFRDLYNRKSLWFWALHAITGEDPVGKGNSGARAVEAWANWGRDRGYSVGNVDIEHTTPAVIEGPEYGTVAQIMERPRP